MVGGPRGAKDLCDDRGSAPRFVRRSFAPTPAPTLSLRMTVGWFWALDNELRNAANPYKHWEFLGSEVGRVGVQPLSEICRLVGWEPKGQIGVPEVVAKQPGLAA